MPEIISPPARPPQRTVRWVMLLGATAGVLVLCVLVLRPFFDVIVWSAVLSIAFYPVHQWLVRVTRGRVSLSAFLCSMLVVATLLLPLLFITGLAINEFLALRDYLQQTFRNGFDVNAVEPLRRALQWLNQRLGVDATEIVAWFTRHASEFGTATAGYSLTVAASVSNAIVSFVFTVFAMFFMFRDGDRIVARIPDLLPFERTRSEKMLSRVRDVIYASVYGVLVIATIQGALCALMFWAVGIPSAVLWGVVTVLTSVLPLVGAAAVWVPGAIYLVAIGQWPQGIVLAVWGAAVISMVDNVLRPKLVGDRVGLSELVTFFALLGGLRVFGLLGIVLGPALFAIAASILEELGAGDPPPSALASE